MSDMLRNIQSMVLDANKKHTRCNVNIIFGEVEKVIDYAVMLGEGKVSKAIQ